MPSLPELLLLRARIRQDHKAAFGERAYLQLAAYEATFDLRSLAIKLDE